MQRITRFEGAIWSIGYDWEQLSDEEREEHAPRLRAAVDKLHETFGLQGAATGTTGSDVGA